MEWYAAYDGKEWGPFSGNELLEFLRGKDPGEVFVWRDGLRDWVLAQDVPSLAAHMRLRVKPPLPIASQSKTQSVSKVKFDNFIVRHWRGELPLWVSYWVIGFLVGIVVAVAIPVIGALFKTEEGFSPLPIFASIVFTWSVGSLLLVWQIVGCWRSAARYIEDRNRLGRRAFWGGAAQVVLVLAVLSDIGNFTRQGVPQLSEAFKIAFRDDPSLPAYAIRVMRDGTEAEIVGGFKYGLTHDFEKILKASPRIKVVHLDSLGGRLGEGEKLYKLIKDKGLDTYVSSRCMSACTLAFAAGKRRYFNKRAVLGFHKGAFPGAQETDFDEGQRRVFTAAGFDSGFIQSALRTPHDDMWKPSTDVLLNAGVITSIVQGDKFAISGLGNISREELGSMLAKVTASYGALKDRFPKEYDAVVSDFHEALMQGKTESESFQVVRGKFIPMINGLIQFADDAVVVEYSRVLVAQYKALNEISPSYCYDYASGDSARSYFNELPKHLQDAEFKVQEKVIRTAQKREKVDEGRVDAIAADVKSKLAAKNITAKHLEVLGVSNLAPARHREYCQTAIAFFNQVIEMPLQDAALFMRSVFAK